MVPPAFARIDIGERFLPQRCQDLPTGERFCQPVFPTLGSLITTLLPNVYMIAGVILFILLIFGGFTYIVSAGQQKPEGVQQGRNAIGAALIGFLLIFASWWIIQIIEVITGIEIFEPEFPI